MLTQRQLFLQHQAQTSDAPLMLEIERAEGVYMYTPEGKPILDLISGISVSNLGHGHPRVKEAIHAQTERYLHLMVYGEVVQSPQVQLAQALCNTLPPPLDNVYFVNSGSEAIEGALKLAKRVTGCTELISCHNAYHGSSHGALSVGGSETFKQNYRPLLPNIRHIRFGVVEDLAHITLQTAAVLLETVQGEAGVRTASQEYFQQLRQRCDETCTLLILDEIQAGFGRTGRFWAFEHYGIVPDILVCAKGMGGGMPIGAFIASKAMMSRFQHNPVLGHITTFGGHPVCAAASLATLQTLQETQVFTQAPAKGQRFYDLLIDHPAVQSIRYIGLMMAVELGNFPFVQTVIQQAIAHGLLTDWFLYCDTALRIAPPLVITEEEIDHACTLLRNAFDAALRFHRNP